MEEILTKKNQNSSQQYIKRNIQFKCVDYSLTYPHHIVENYRNKHHICWRIRRLMIIFANIFFIIFLAQNYFLVVS